MSNSWGAFVEAARPRTLPAAVAPVVVGTAAAQDVVWWRAAAALVVALAIQVAVNYANDLSDAASGVDTEERVGPRRAVASGAITPKAMKAAIGVAMVIAGGAGVALAAAVGWELLWVGLAAFTAALAYSGGPRPYASLGLGEIFVFVFFGLVATAGSAYVHDERLTQVAYVAAIPIGCMATAILVANNLRDLATDSAAGKRTLAVRIGAPRTRILFQALITVALIGTIGVALAASSYLPLLALAAAPVAVRPTMTVLYSQEPGDLIAALAGTARLELIYALLLAIGLWGARA